MNPSSELQSPFRGYRLSQYFRLPLTQPLLDFVDIDIEGDLPVFIDPTALLPLHSPWASRCVALIQDFFQHILHFIAAGQGNRASALLAILREPNETHLGLSEGRARGRGLGPHSAVWLRDALAESEAINTGLLEDLEDTILMVNGVAGDLVSDIATNLMRAPLLEYTEAQCRSLDMPLTAGMPSGPLWDPIGHVWYARYCSRLRGPMGALLLVPKVLVRRKLEYDYDEYYRDYLLPFLGDAELEAKSALVTVLKSGSPKVFKKDLTAKYGCGKGVVVRQTQAHPEILARYREDKRAARQLHRPPLTHLGLASAVGAEAPDWNQLFKAVRSLPPGPDAAPAYHDAVFNLLNALFYPALVNGRKEQQIHNGLKRIDVLYENAATSGFFQWLGVHYPAPFVFVECKNYGKELGNPELDQMIGRFSPSRGKFGIIVCRTLDDPERFYQRCQNTADDDNGFIMALTDDDLRDLVDSLRDSTLRAPTYDLIRQRFQHLVLRADLSPVIEAPAPSPEPQEDGLA